jgi:hypothetical protein
MASSQETRLEEMQRTAQAIARLASDEKAFAEAVEAVRTENTELFQAVLGRVGLLGDCHLVCSYLCTKHCVWLCRHLVGRLRPNGPFNVKEMRQFADLTVRLSDDPKTMKKLMDAADAEDAKAFQTLVKQLEIGRFAHQLCHWLCAVRCRLVCQLLCPPPPLITEIGEIPTGQFDSLGYASGPSIPVSYTPADNFGAGIGHHPFGGLTKINGVFNVTGATQYKVEWATAPGGPWATISTTIPDLRWVGFLQSYDRTPSGGWYDVADMGLGSEGQTYLTDWPTPAAVNDLYYLKLTVRNAALVEFESSVYPVKVDNTHPTVPSISLELKLPDGTVRQLGCCEEVDQGDGNTILVTLQASDANFSVLSVNLQGGCNVSLPVVDINGVPLGKSYSGNIADTGYPVATTFEWDPWAANVDPCCYLIYVRIWDRAIVSNQWGGRHHRSAWHSITIA